MKNRTQVVNAGCFHSRQTGINQVHHLGVFRVREGREETGEEGREDRDMEDRTKYGLRDKTKKIKHRQ